MNEAIRPGHGHRHERGDAETERLMRSATYAAVLTAVILIAIKTVAWWLTGSVALLGSLIDSALDLAASSVNLFAVHHALAPRDHEHRFGHGKAEALAGLLQACIIALSALFLIYECGSRLIEPTPVPFGTVGIIVILISMVLTLLLVRFQSRVVRRSNSLAISADELHYRGDLLMNAAVIVALVLAGVLGIVIADPIIGFGVAIYILFAAWEIMQQSFDQLMDREFPDDKRQQVRNIVLSHADVRSVHDLRTRSAGRHDFIQLHLELDPTITLIKAHRIADEVEYDLLNEFPQAEIIIHQDPAGIEDIPTLDKK